MEQCDRIGHSGTRGVSVSEQVYSCARVVEIDYREVDVIKTGHSLFLTSVSLTRRPVNNFFIDMTLLRISQNSGGEPGSNSLDHRDRDGLCLYYPSTRLAQPGTENPTLDLWVLWWERGSRVGHMLSSLKDASWRITCVQDCGVTGRICHAQQQHLASSEPSW